MIKTLEDLTWFILFVTATWLAVACAAPVTSVTEAWEPPADRACPTRTVIDCGGAVRPGNLTIRESCTTVRHCTIAGQVSIRGQWSSAAHVSPELSRQADYVDIVRAQAPHDVWFEDSVVHGTPGKVAIYFGPGVTFSGLRRVTVAPTDCTVPVYLGAETSRIYVDDSTIYAGDCDREAIAVDASDFFAIRRNTIHGGGVHLYRNCGESGVTRQTTPSDGRVVDNHFFGAGLMIYLGSRDVRNRWQEIFGGGYCPDDDGWDIGSSDHNRDYPRRNLVRDNRGAIIVQGSTASGNVIEGNTL